MSLLIKCSGLTVTPGALGAGYMQTVPLVSAVAASASRTNTIQVYDSDGVRISFVCEKDPNDHFRCICVVYYLSEIDGDRVQGLCVDIVASALCFLCLMTVWQCHYYRNLRQCQQRVRRHELLG
jgi:hypothetical protein